jgi:hypothetical protein
MSPELVSLIVIIACTLLPIVLDIWLAKTYGVQFTISDTIRRAGRQWPWVVLVLSLSAGCLLGHFFLCPACGE